VVMSSLSRRLLSLHQIPKWYGLCRAVPTTWRRRGRDNAHYIVTICLVHNDCRFVYTLLRWLGNVLSKFLYWILNTQTRRRNMHYVICRSTLAKWSESNLKSWRALWVSNIFL
jgi:hypothetical protein